MAVGQADGKCYINELPDELLVKILDLVPIENAFADMRVSKRWTAACRYIVRKRESLIIGNDDWYYYAGDLRGWDWHRNQPSPELDRIFVPEESLVPLMIKSLNQIESVTQLCVSGMSPEYVIPVIRKLAQQLTLLEVNFAMSGIGSDVVFPHLRQLYCWIFDPEKASAFPNLAELLIHGVTEPQNEKRPDVLLPRLKRLLFLYPDNCVQFRELILANAGNLEFLCVKSFRMRFDPAVVFEQLIELECGGIHFDMINSFPAMRHLWIRNVTRGKFLKHLPAALMLSLQIELGIPGDDDDDAEEDEDEEGEGVADHDVAEELEPCLTAISGMRHLKKLAFAVGCVYWQKRPDLSHGTEQHVSRTA